MSSSAHRTERSKAKASRAGRAGSGSDTHIGTHIGKVAVFPLAGRTFDYILQQRIAPGSRVQVKFRGKTRYGILVEYAESSQYKLKPVDAVLDEEAIVNPKLFKLLKWMGQYYQGEIDRVLFLALPSAIRQGKTIHTMEVWHVCDAGDQQTIDARLEALRGAPKQLGVYKALLKYGDQGGADAQTLGEKLTDWRAAMRALIEKDFVATGPAPASAQSDLQADLPALTKTQTAAFQIVNDDQFACHLFDGVTGSGKTVIYLHLIKRALDAGKQVLVMVPEIGLAYELLHRCREYFGALRVTTYHSDMGATLRARIWASVRSGDLSVVIGTRSAVFMPFARLGLIVIDEEHDASYKESALLPYHARDVAIKRADGLGIPVVLGSATPAMETLWNVRTQRYRSYSLSERYAGAQLPGVEVIDMRGTAVDAGLSPRLIALLGECVERKEMALLFLNRRGYAPRLLCHACGVTPECPRCDRPMVWHLRPAVLHCHHCDLRRPVPKQCAECGGTDLRPLGQGTERIEERIAELFPDYPVTRMDSDSVRHRNAREKQLRAVMERGHGILIGTQMIAKGHHFPTVTLAGIIDVDQYFLSTDFRAIERLGQLVVQVSGRAGRGELAGRVALQTWYPEHPSLSLLLNKSYNDFSTEILKDRERFVWPPFRSLAVVRAVSRKENSALNQLRAIHTHLKQQGANKVEVYPPLLAVVEKIANYHRARLLLAANQRKDLSRCLMQIREMIAKNKASDVHWQIDVDPLTIE